MFQSWALSHVEWWHVSNRTRWLLPLLLICGFGCASKPYQYGHFGGSTNHDSVSEVAFEYGRPNKILDRMAWVAGVPSRVLSLSSEVNNHSLSRASSEKVATYLQENDLNDVLVRVNQYDPAGEWRRLRSNVRMAPGWRYSVGLVGLAGYTLFPGRVFGGDHYNPFTNSLHVNSDVPALLIVEAAYAKDIHSRRLPGTYAAINEFPVLAIWRYSKSVDDALGYAKLNDDWDVEKETYRIVYPLIGLQVAMGGHSTASGIARMSILTAPISAISGSIAGHACGQTAIALRESQRNSKSSNDSPDGVEPGEVEPAGVEPDGVEPDDAKVAAKSAQAPPLLPVKLRK